jgi:hypothetical protein
MICTLIDLGWSPAAPSRWTDPDGEEFDLDDADLDQLVDFELLGSLDQAVWERASAHHLGGGLRKGADLTVPRRFLQGLRRRGHHGEAAMAQMVLTGSLWPASRRHGGQEGGALGKPQAGSATGELQDSQAQAASADDPQAGLQDAERATETLRNTEAKELGQDPARGGDGGGTWGDDPLICQGCGPEDDEAEFPASEARTVLCPRCGLEEETTFHQLWSCQANTAISGTHLELLPEAREQHLEAPCFWLGGLPPLD